MKKISGLLAVLLMLLILPVNAYGYSAKALVVYEPSRQVFLDKVCENQRLPMASTTKIMTALVVLENTDLELQVKIPSEAVGVEGSSMYLTSGEQLTVYELLYGLMLTSGNDAAMALAHFVGGGSIQTFVSMMNKKAAELSLENTNFTNPSGLPDDNHYTTAAELAIITAKALENPVFAKIVKTRTIKISYKGIEGGRTLINHNKLLAMYDGAIGVKTGFTKKAGRCLVSAAEKNGATLICVTLSAPDDWDDHITALDKGFERVQRVCLAGKDEIEVALKTADGKTVYARNLQRIEATVIDGKMPIKQIVADNFVYAPKKTGDTVGCVKFHFGQNDVLSSELYITSNIEQIPKKETFITRILNFIRNLF